MADNEVLPTAPRPAETDSGAAVDSTVKTEIDSTVKPPALVVLPGGFDSTVKPSLFIPETELIELPAAKWKRPAKGTVKPPVPPRHALDAKGRRGSVTGWQIMRRERCPACTTFGEQPRDVRLVVGYLSASQMVGLRRENHEIQVGIIRNILRGRAGEIDGALVNLRCPRCASRREGNAIFHAR